MYLVFFLKSMHDGGTLALTGLPRVRTKLIPASEPYSCLQIATGGRVARPSGGGGFPSPYLIPVGQFFPGLVIHELPN